MQQLTVMMSSLCVLLDCVDSDDVVIMCVLDCVDSDDVISICVLDCGRAKLVVMVLPRQHVTIAVLTPC